MDQVSLIARQAIDTLFLSHRTRTCLGIVLGYSVYILKEIFSPILLNKFGDIVNLNAINAYNSVILGILIMQSRNIIILFSRKPYSDEKIDSLLQMIEDSDQLGMPQWQKRQMYNALFLKIIDNVELNEKTREYLKILQKPKKR